MTKRVTDAPSVEAFVDVASRFCLLIEKRSELRKIEFLQRAYVLLPELVLRAAKLQEINRWDLSEHDMTSEQWQEIYGSLRSKLRRYDGYLEIFNPYDRKKKPVYGSLSDDLADIYRDVLPGLMKWRDANARERRDIVATWWLNYAQHWGWHATDALKALYVLLYHRMDYWNTGYKIRWMDE